MELRDLLESEGIDPDSTLVMRHRPTEPELRRALPWLAADRPQTYNAYQQFQGPTHEKQLLQAYHLASFIGHTAGKALFVGVYKNHEPQKMTAKERANLPEYKELMKLGLQNGSEPSMRFDLRLCSAIKEWQGKLVIEWPGLEKSWSRWAHSQSRFRVFAIHEESLLTEAMPDWRSIVLTWEELKLIPVSWQAAIREWRGVYLITDSKSGKYYVGSAYGKENILGRWLSYSKTGDGGNVKLKKLDPGNFRFSILERLSPDTTPSDAIQCERSWKQRLHTVKLGLNSN